MPQLKDYSPQTQRRWKANPFIERVIQDVMARARPGMVVPRVVVATPVAKEEPPPEEPDSGSESDPDMFGLFD